MYLEHPDLVANLVFNSTNDGALKTLGQGFVDAPNSHDTVVANIIGMFSNNSVEDTGIAWDAKVVPALNLFESGKLAKIFLANQATNPAVSVNYWGDDQTFAENFGAAATISDRAWCNAIIRCATERRGDLGMVIGVSGGNARF